jgi:hypothetical protein
MDFRIADIFPDSLARLAKDEQKAVKTTAFDLQINPTSPGMSFHEPDRAEDGEGLPEHRLVTRAELFGRLAEWYAGGAPAPFECVSSSRRRTSASRSSAFSPHQGLRSVS